jgi:PAS domain S-box-containing protein
MARLGNPSDTEQLTEAAHLRALLDSVSGYGIYMLDAEGRVASWNDGAKRITGYEADEIVGHSHSRFYTECDQDGGAPHRNLQIATVDGRYEGEGWRVRKDGAMFFAHVVIETVRGEDGRPVGFAKITRDITERHESQLALQRAQAQRDQLQRMEVLGQLTGGVAHDFNNILMVVSGHLQTLKRLVGEDPKGRRAADAIDQAARRGEALTRQLLTFSRRQTLRPEVVDLNERLPALEQMVAGVLGSACRLQLDLEPELWPIRADRSELELALMNLALNARDALNCDGTITVRARNAPLEGGSAPDGLDGDFVALSVIDTGSGIAPDILAKVFDPFFTTKQAHLGSGLGLSQAHGFAHQSGGTVTIASELGAGTVVTLYLPRSDSPPKAAVADAAPETADGGSVLLVEDNPEVSEASAALLEELGYRVHAVGDASAALRVIDEGRSFDIMVSDIVMAGAMDGVGLAKAVRKRRPELPILLVTGYSRAAEQLGGEFCLLRKPFQVTDLYRAAAKAIRETRQPVAASA